MKEQKKLTEAEIQEIDREILELGPEIDRLDNVTFSRDLEIRRLGDQIDRLLAKKGKTCPLTERG